MCRMIVALGEIEAKKLIDDFVLIAQGKNELHERNNTYGSYKHSDGWGISYIKDNKWHTYKSTKPVYEDSKINDFKDIKAKAVILHVRKATKGRKTIANTQPIVYNDYLFTHNGHINDSIYSKKYTPGDSDTVMWFNKILDDLNKHKEDYYTFDNYSSANFFLVTPEKIVVGQDYKNDPVYHTMKMYRDSNKMIISSEILPAYKHKNWENIENGCLIEINYKIFA